MGTTERSAPGTGFKGFGRRPGSQGSTGLGPKSRSTRPRPSRGSRRRLRSTVPTGKIAGTPRLRPRQSPAPPRPQGRSGICRERPAREALGRSGNPERVAFRRSSLGVFFVGAPGESRQLQSRRMRGGRPVTEWATRRRDAASQSDAHPGADSMNVTRDEAAPPSRMPRIPMGSAGSMWKLQLSPDSGLLSSQRGP